MMSPIFDLDPACNIEYTWVKGGKGLDEYLLMLQEILLLRKVYLKGVDYLHFLYLMSKRTLSTLSLSWKSGYVEYTL